MSSTKYEIINKADPFSDFSEEVFHYGKMVVALRETIRLMGEVDGVIESAGGWPVK